ncbi:MAG: hypothetical protein WDZ80_05030 [Candidatus Paceibacterota bacterium]
MIIYFYGPDSYRRNKKLKEVIEAYKKNKRNIDVLSVDLEDNPEEWIKVKDFLNQPSIFIDSKLAIIKGLNSLEEKDWIKTLKSYVENEDKVFIVGSDKKKPNRKFNFLLKDSVKSQKFEELGSVELSNLVNKLSKKYGIEFEKKAKNLFISFVISKENRHQLTENEMFKLSCLKFKKPIEIKDLNELINWRDDEKMFKAVRSLLYTVDPETKIVLLEKLLAREDSEDYVFNSAVYQVKGDDLMNFGELDVLRKSGKIRLEEGLLDFILPF